MCKYGKFPLGHPTVYYGENIPDHVEGLLKCTILPPRRLYHPILPVRSNNKLLFPLCRTCAETCQQTPCDHTDEERMLTGTWVSLEIEKALSLGYRMVKKYSAWHFPETTQYDPETSEGGLWAQYTDLWLKLKQEASGYPSWCQSEADRRRYVREYEEKENIRLDPAKIRHNPGLRSLSKMMLNR